MSSKRSSLLSLKDVQTSVRPRRRPREIEDAEQIALIGWLRLHHPLAATYTTHPPNGGVRSKREAGRFRAMGVSPGVPDVLCFLRCGRFNGLAIELKRPGAPPSAVSREQLLWLKLLDGQGWKTAICRGFEEAKPVIDTYMKLGPGSPP